jgi:DNA-binding NarL/FixJ family response regulator
MDSPATNGEWINRDLPSRSANPGRGLYLPATWRALGRELQLSPRELEITQSLFDDHKEETIAQDLRISVHTVHTYVKRIYQKLVARSRVEVICIVVAAERQLSSRQAIEQNGHRIVLESNPDTNGISLRENQ